MTETNQILSKIANVEETTADDQKYEVADEKEVEAISKKLIEQNLEAYKKLAEWVKKVENIIIPISQKWKKFKNAKWNLNNIERVPNDTLIFLFLFPFELEKDIFVIPYNIC